MNFKSIIVVGLGVATLGLSLPAHADSVVKVDNDQRVIMTGKHNLNDQKNSTFISTTERKTRDSSATLVGNVQRADIDGFDLVNQQDNFNDLRNERIRTRTSR